MHCEELFAAWAPAESIWSPWAKPVVFAHLKPPSADPPESNWQAIEAPWATRSIPPAPRRRRVLHSA